MHEFDETVGQWVPFEPEARFPTRVVMTCREAFEGHDLVTFPTRTSPGCSPLSCNPLDSRLVIRFSEIRPASF